MNNLIYNVQQKKKKKHELTNLVEKFMLNILFKF